MKKILSLIFAAVLATSASAQTAVGVAQTGCSGGVTRSSTAAQDQSSMTSRNLHNTKTCLANALAKTCTQVQLDARPGCAGGVCGTIYATTATGARQYALDKMFQLYFDAIGNEVTAATASDTAAAVIQFGGLTDTNLNCSNAGLSNGCLRSQVSCVYLTGAPDCKP
jgi:hypothetical protein